MSAKILALLPTKLRESYLRSQLAIHYGHESSVKYKIAETEDEHNQLKAQKMRKNQNQEIPDNSEPNYKKYDVIAIINGTIIGSLGIEFDETQAQKSDDRSAASVGNNQGQPLIVKIERPILDERYNRFILLSLFKFAFTYSRQNLGADLVIAVSIGSWNLFFQDLLLFKEVDLGEGTKYKKKFFGKKILVVDLRTYDESLSQVYWGRPFGKDLYHFLRLYQNPKFQLPELPKAVVPSVKPSGAEDIKWPLFVGTNQDDALIKQESSITLTPIPHTYEPIKSERIDYRYSAEMNFHLFDPNGKLMKSDAGTVESISHSGLGIKTEAQLELKDEVRMIVEFSPENAVPIIGEIRWKNELGRFGVKIVEKNESWTSTLQKWLQDRQDEFQQSNGI